MDKFAATTNLICVDEMEDLAFVHKEWLGEARELEFKSTQILV